MVLALPSSNVGHCNLSARWRSANWGRPRSGCRRRSILSSLRFRALIPICQLHHRRGDTADHLGLRLRVSRYMPARRATTRQTVGSAADPEGGARCSYGRSLLLLCVVAFAISASIMSVAGTSARLGRPQECLRQGWGQRARGGGAEG